MIKFNDNNIYVGYIKQLLKDFNLPNCQVYREELKDFYNSENTHLAYIKDNAVYRGDKVVSTYNFNDKITNITNNLHITSNIYDSKTHKYLGEYLRFIRDYTGLDLMQMYNCFTNESPVNVHLDDFDSDNDNYQLFILPIKFNRIYTIGIDCLSRISLKACHYENKDLVDNSYNVKYSAQYKSGTRFNKPFIFKSPEVESTEQLAEEKTLKLLIKIPFSCKSSIVVLEGDYRRGCDLLLNNNKQVLASTVSTNGDKPLINYYVDDSEEETNKINYYVSKPQLLYLNTETCYLLADRLCEYLSRNVIDSNEEIMYNIRFVQKAIHSEDFSNSYINDYTDADDRTKERLRYNPIYYGMWDDRIRELLYNFDFKYKNTYNREVLINNNFDMLGYYDKDTEYGMQYLVKEDETNFEV